MHRLQFHYTLSRDSSPAMVRNPLIDLLQAVSAQGSISGGARALGLSYRHVWGELKRWEQELGNELVVWEKGQSAKLTEFGAKLMWAERQAQARLAPQIEALRAELERSFAVAFDDKSHVVTLHASHDVALSSLREHALRLEQGQLHLDIRFSGSVDAIRALNEGRCVMAGFHTLQDAGAQTLTQRTYQPLLQPGQHKDELLTRAGIADAQINGYERTEPSHAAVAHAVAAGQADAALGIAVAAEQAGLDFVPWVNERYHLVCLKSALTQPGIIALLALLRSPAWRSELGAIPGYAALQSGEVLSMRRILPWWDFQRTKRANTAKAGAASG
ncbi:MAG: LysR family transcriptional regulator [Burkholderiales bacterium]|nr:LysR family transcriptional regulator [Burkholderiales bacterium]